MTGGYIGYKIINRGDNLKRIVSVLLLLIMVLLTSCANQARHVKYNSIDDVSERLPTGYILPKAAFAFDTGAWNTEYFIVTDYHLEKRGDKRARFSCLV